MPLFFKITYSCVQYHDFQPQIEASGTDSALEKSYLKRTAFSQYFSLVQDMRDYEKGHFEKFTSKATYNINSVMKRNILKLEFSNQVVQEDTSDNKSSSSLSSVALSKVKINKRPSGLGSALHMRKSGKFDRLIKVVGWMTNKKNPEDQHLAFAEKIIKATKSISSVKTESESTPDFTLQQARCTYFII